MFSQGFSPYGYEPNRFNCSQPPQRISIPQIQAPFHLQQQQQSLASLSSPASSIQSQTTQRQLQEKQPSFTFLGQKPVPMKQSGTPPTKLYRGVRQRHGGKWVAEIRTPKNRNKLWLGTFDTAEEAALAYDMAAYKLWGDSARIKFSDLRHQGGHQLANCKPLHSSVEAKLQHVLSNLDKPREKLASFQCQITTKSPSGSGISHNGQETSMQPYSSNQPEPDSDEVNSINYEELKKHFGKKHGDVAQIFGVRISTIKQKCRENGVSSFPQGKINKINDSPSTSTSRRDPPCSDLPAEKFVAIGPHKTPLVAPPPPPPPPQVVRTITIKATCGDDVLKFQLPCSSTMVELEEEVSKRLKYVATFKVKYADNDDDQVLIACDKDLENCISASNSLGMNKVEMFIVPITKISPST